MTVSRVRARPRLWPRPGPGTTPTGERANGHLACLAILRLQEVLEDVGRPIARLEQRAHEGLAHAIRLLGAKRRGHFLHRVRIADLAQCPRRVESHVVV